ncbi:phage tail protein I [Pseudoalteromonas sp. JBTF-M23]|uniref:Phage tail protein I n=1 Tax=Pseudoalteromonas caenipelagi TaxID=2726988 RepID=A0A849VC39_9GAMM|nr:phage tail protein I [Pseudoalteromonas caenipelagi]NOU49524.1 phage tail protein I [Pseudoalteromonas caenipelagi]
MSDATQYDPLLPVSSSLLEHGLSGAAARIEKLPVPLQHLWNPWQCPAHFLPWLAHGLSVDTWDSNWPEHIQRQVIADSVPSHRIKGTFGALKQSLSALDAELELQEWWQTGGAPHTATIVALATHNLDENGDTFITPKLQAQLWRAVAANKPARTQIDFHIGNIVQNQLYFSPVSTATQITQAALEQNADGQFEQNNLYVSARNNHIQLATQQLSQNTESLLEPVTVYANSGGNQLHIAHSSLKQNQAIQFDMSDLYVDTVSGSTTFQILTMEIT